MSVAVYDWTRSDRQHSLIDVLRPESASTPALASLPPRQRAIAVLLCSGEDPTLVGMRLAIPGQTPWWRSRAHLAALDELDRAAEAIAPARLPRAPAWAWRLRATLRDEHLRWPLLLKVSGCFETPGQIAEGLGVHRSRVFRHLRAATAGLRAQRDATRMSHAVPAAPNIRSAAQR